MNKEGLNPVLPMPSAGGGVEQPLWQQVQFDMTELFQQEYEYFL